MSKQKEIKAFPSRTFALDQETGIVTAYVSVMGIQDDDHPPDIIEPGAFVKSIAERGPQGAGRIRVLWQHSPWDVIGMPLELMEHPRDALPPQLIAQFPNASGGLFTRVQFILDVQRGREAVALYKAGAMTEWSIGFDAIRDQMETVAGATIRRLLEIRLWEYSSVTWGMNPGTVTTGVKNLDNEQVAAEVARLGIEVMGLSPSLPPLKMLGIMAAQLRKAEPPTKALTAQDRADLVARVDAAYSRLKK